MGEIRHKKSGAVLLRYDGERPRTAVLTAANVSGADLRHAHLAGADLSQANLTGADLAGADLTGADLRGALLAEADLRGADLTGADLTGADLLRVTYDRDTRWPAGYMPPDAKLSEAEAVEFAEAPG